MAAVTVRRWTILAGLLLLLAPALLPAQVALTWKHIPKQTAEWIIRAQATACQVADTASGPVLDGLDLALRRMIEERDAQTRRIAADSADGLAADRELQQARTRLKALETEIGPLHAERNRINSDQAPYEARIQAALRGDNPARRSLDEVNEDLRALREAAGRDSLALADFLKKNPNPSWVDGTHEMLGAALAKKRSDIARLEAQQLAILRSTFRDRFDPEYERLVREERANEERIGRLEPRLDALRQRVQELERSLRDVDLAALRNLEQLREINGFVEQYLHLARDCVQKRRQALASGAAVPPSDPSIREPDRVTGTISGRWSVPCVLSGGDPYTEAGTFTLAFGGNGGVNGSYTSQAGGFQVGGSVDAAGEAQGSGSHPDGSFSWLAKITVVEGRPVLQQGSVYFTPNTQSVTCNTGTLTSP